MFFANEQRRSDRRVAGFYRLLGLYHRAHATNLGWAGLFLLLLLFAMNHQHGWMSR
jgi:hypothetical protein